MRTSKAIGRNQGPSEMSIDMLQLSIRTRNRLWDPRGQLDKAFHTIELAGEVGELCNLIKKEIRADLSLVGSRTTTEETADELADVLICTIKLMDYLGLDVARTVKKKFNETSTKHGFNVFI